MRNIKIAGLVLASMLLMGMALAGTAAAGPLWATCQKVLSGLTRYEDENCEKANGTGSWSETSLAGTEKSVAAGTLLLVDTGTAVGEVVVSCTGEALGSVGPTNLGRTEEIKNIKCTTEKGCEAGSTPTAEPVNLPWKTELTETESRLQASLKSEVSGKEAGWKVKCKVVVQITDECTTNSGLLTYLGAQFTPGFFQPSIKRWLHLFEFLNTTGHKATCSQAGGKKETGEIRGHLAILAYRFNGTSNEDRNLLLRAN